MYASEREVSLQALCIVAVLLLLSRVTVLSACLHLTPSPRNHFIARGGVLLTPNGSSEHPEERIRAGTCRRSDNDDENEQKARNHEVVSTKQSVTYGSMNAFRKSQNCATLGTLSFGTLSIKSDGLLSGSGSGYGIP